ncbi:MAG: hypothetical protein KIT69_14710 [Propionibacteriaceae bacterium]|nr:hypothetical protein [Propionibacteriaceae bacterium]
MRADAGQRAKPAGAAWWVSFFPGAAIIVTVVAITAIGRYLPRPFRGELAS